MAEGTGALIGGWGGPLSSSPPQTVERTFEAIPHVGLSAHTTTSENRGADADTWIPAFAGMTVGTAHYLCEESIFEAIPHVGLVPHHNQRNRRADADTWIPAFAGMTGGAWGGIAVLSPRCEVPACAGVTGGVGMTGEVCAPPPFLPHASLRWRGPSRPSRLREGLCVTPILQRG